MTDLKVILTFEKDILTSKSDGWSLLLIRKLERVYIEWHPRLFYSESELRKIHRHFFHPHLDRLFAVLKRADAESVSPKVFLDTLKIQSTCDVCQRSAAATHQFGASLPNIK